jgi:hypothetical protein
VKAYAAFWSRANSLCVDQDDPNVIEIWNVSEDAFSFFPSHVILLEVIHMAHQGRNCIKMPGRFAVDSIIKYFQDSLLIRNAERLYPV